MSRIEKVKDGAEDTLKQGGWSCAATWFQVSPMNEPPELDRLELPDWSKLKPRQHKHGSLCILVCTIFQNPATDDE